MTLTFRYDPVADAAYIYVKHPIESGEVRETVPVDVSERTPVGSGINLDFDAVGRLLGVEILGARRILGEETLRRLSG
jgi:uncharacterized protein YuzE